LRSDEGLRGRSRHAEREAHQVHRRRQAVDTNVPIACGDAPVWPGGVIVGDADGCIVIPAHLADEAVGMTAFDAAQNLS
jgi:regulator of RNase E activity RraA